MKPILFSTPMVKAIREGRKTQTRRVMNPQPAFIQDDWPNFWKWKDCQWADGGLGMPQSGIDDYAPYKPGDILWVRETIQQWGFWFEYTNLKTGKRSKAFKDATDEKHPYLYAGNFVESPTEKIEYGYWKRPSIFMPREAARIFLEVKDVRCERLQDINDEDAEAEGVILGGNYKQYKYGYHIPGESYRESFSHLWDSLNAKRGYSWNSNPWVWANEFEMGDHGDV